MASSGAGASSNRGLYTQLAGRVAQRVPFIKALPVVRLIMAADVLLIGKHHLDRLSSEERGQLMALVAKGKGRPKNLTAEDQAHLQTLVDKLEPRQFLAEATERLSPVGVPGPLRSRLAGDGRRAKK